MLIVHDVGVLNRAWSEFQVLANITKAVNFG